MDLFMQRPPPSEPRSRSHNVNRVRAEDNKFPTERLLRRMVQDGGYPEAGCGSRVYNEIGQVQQQTKCLYSRQSSARRMALLLLLSLYVHLSPCTWHVGRTHVVPRSYLLQMVVYFEYVLIVGYYSQVEVVRYTKYTSNRKKR